MAVNAGSSSLKFKLYEMPEEKVLCSGNAERIGHEDAIFGMKWGKESEKKVLPILDHAKGVELIVQAMIEKGIVKSMDEIVAVGHRIVQGGKYFSKSELFNEDTEKKIEALIPLAPLHNKAHLVGFRAFKKILPDVVNVAVFDTAFHQTMEPQDYVFPIPSEYTEKYDEVVVVVGDAHVEGIAELLSDKIVPVYVISNESMFIIKFVNTFFGIFLILLCVFIYAFIVNHIEENLELQVKNQTLDIKEKNKKVDELQNHIIYSLASLVENRDSDTGAHINRTSSYIKTIAKAASERGVYKDILTDDYIALLERAAPLHDIGKIVVPDAILKKPGKFTEDEFALMKTHTVKGSEIIQEIIGVSDDKIYLETALGSH